MFGNLVEIFTLNVKKPSAPRALQMIMIAAAVPGELITGALTVVKNKTAHRALPCQALKMALNSGFADGAPAVRKAAHNILGCEMPASVLTDETQDKVALLCIISHLFSPQTKQYEIGNCFQFYTRVSALSRILRTFCFVRQLKYNICSTPYPSRLRRATFSTRGRHRAMIHESPLRSGYEHLIPDI